MRVREASIDEFVDYPYILYRGCKNWVGDLKVNTKKLLSTSHPFWERAERRLFVCEKNGRVCGRIAGIINHLHNEFWKEKVCFWGFFDCENELEVSRMLFRAVEDYAKEKGMEILRGPANPSSNYTWGLLVENFDEPNCLMMPYNFEYYQDLVLKNGYVKEKDLYAYKWSIEKEVSLNPKLIERIKRLNPDISIEHADLSNLRKVFEDVKNVYNKAWEKNWGFVPMTDGEIEEMAKELKFLLKDDYLTFARNAKGEAVAFSLILPDFNIVLSEIGGSINLFNIWKVLWRYLFRIDRGRVLTLGVNYEYRGRGIEALLIGKAIEVAKKYSWRTGELSWTLEDNVKINKTIERFGGVLYKRYRIFRKEIN